MRPQFGPRTTWGLFNKFNVSKKGNSLQRGAGGSVDHVIFFTCFRDGEINNYSTVTC